MENNLSCLFLSFSSFNMYRQTPYDVASLLGYEQCAQFLRNHSCATGKHFPSKLYYHDLLAKI